MHLPFILSVDVYSLSLYTEDLHRSFHPGVNVIIGGNGIGKSTLINTFAYGVIGDSTIRRFNPATKRFEKNLYVPKDYFLGRIEPRDREQSKATVDFRLGATTFSVTRHLFKRKLLNFSVETDGQKKQFSSPDTIDADYVSEIEKASDLNFDHFAFLTATLLIFDETRRTLLWESDTQNRVIRHLFVERSLDRKIEQLSEDETKYDTKARHLSETKKDINRAIERWYEQQAEFESVIGQPAPQSPANSESLRSSINALEIERAEILEQVESLHENSSIETGDIAGRSIELTDLQQVLDSYEADLSSIESEYMGAAYAAVPSEYLIILDGLVRRGLCKVCNTESSELKRLGEKLQRDHQCVVCRSPIQEPSHQDSSFDETKLARMTELQTEIDRGRSHRRELVASLERSKSTLQKITAQVDAFQSRLREIELTITAQKNALAFLDGGSGSEGDPWLVRQEKEMASLDWSAPHKVGH